MIGLGSCLRAFVTQFYNFAYTIAAHFSVLFRFLAELAWVFFFLLLVETRDDERLTYRERIKKRQKQASHSVQATNTCMWLWELFLKWERNIHKIMNSRLEIETIHSVLLRMFFTRSLNITKYTEIPSHYKVTQIEKWVHGSRWWGGAKCGSWREITKWNGLSTTCRQRR